MQPVKEHPVDVKKTYVGLLSFNMTLEPFIKKRGKNIIWVHLHKYGGTFVCQTAKAIGEKISKNGFANCNWPGDGYGRGPSMGENFEHQALCKERAESPFITFSGIERGLVPGDLGCAGVTTGIMLREPLSAALSSQQFDMHMNVGNLIRQIAKGEEPGELDYDDFRRGRVTWRNIDNFVVRTLSGEFSKIPVNQVSREHLEIAKGVLQRIDVVILLENLATQKIQLTRYFGWPSEDVHADRPANARGGAKGLQKEVFEIFKKVNWLDYELYEFGRQLAENRTAAAAAALASGSDWAQAAPPTP